VARRSGCGSEFELSADPRFRSIALGSGFGTGAFRTHVTAATIDKSVPDGTYYWRVRGITASDGSGAWSPTRRIFKAWTIAPAILGPDAGSVSWPADPLVLRWSAVPYATKYLVWLATDPGLSNLVLGSTSSP
jgi:hypothetical protein